MKTSLLVLACTSAIAFHSHAQNENASLSSDTSADDTSIHQTFQEGLIVGNGRFAWLNAAQNLMYLRLHEMGREADLRNHFINNMWLSIIDLDRFTKNSAASQQDRNAATKILSQVVDYFKRHPRNISRPSGDQFAIDIQHAIEAEQNPKRKQILEDMTAASEAQLLQIEGFMNSVLFESYRRDLLTQAVLNRLIETEQGAAAKP